MNRFARLLFTFERRHSPLVVVSRPGRAFGIPKRIEDTAVETAQDVTHQIECAIGEEVGTVNVSNVRRKEARTIHVPHVVRRRRRIRQWRTMRKSAATKAPHAEML